MHKYRIKQIQPVFSSKDFLFLKQAYNSNFLTENDFTKKFEAKISNIVGSKYSCATSNWTLGLYSCIKALNIGEGDEVIVPNLTFIATSNAVILSGAKPVLCEVNINTLCIDEEKIVKLINKKTKAIILVHLYGNCCDINKIKKISNKKNIKIIEDAAQALGVRYNKKFVGTLGDVGGYSFYANKIITSGEGGIAVTNNLNIKRKIYQIKNHGRDKKGIYIHKNIGYNFSTTEMQSSIGLSQLFSLKKNIKKKKYIYEFYQKKLKNIPQIKFIKANKFTDMIPWFTNICAPKALKLSKFLNKNGIEIRRIFYPLNLQPCYLKNKNLVKNLNGNFNISKYVYNNFLSLPSSSNIKDQELKFVCDKIIKFYKSD